MDQVVKALSASEIEEIEAKSKPKPKAKKVLPAGFEAEKIVQLLVPIEFDGTVYENVSIRRLKGRDFLRLQKLAGDEDVGLLAIVTGLPVAVIEELDGDDFAVLSEASQDFLPRRLREEVEQTSAAGQGSQP